MTTLAPSFLIESSLFLQVTRPCMKAWLDELKFWPNIISDSAVICPWASETLIYNLNTLAPSFLIGCSSFLQVTRTTIKFRISFKFGQIGPRTVELAALERLKKSPWTYNGTNVVTHLTHSFLIESSSFLQVTRTCMKAWMDSNFCQIQILTQELSALERLKNWFTKLWPL